MPNTLPMSRRASKLALSALNELVIACRDEELALEAAAAAVHGAERRFPLQDQSRRKVLLRRDLGAAVATLGGVSPEDGSRWAWVSLSLWKARALVTGRGPGEDYDACARAADRTARAYSNVLRLELPGAVRLTLDLRRLGIDSDRRELHRLRRGGSATSRLGAGFDGQKDTEEDRRALDAWGEDGGSP